MDEVWSALDGLADADLLEQRVAPPGGDAISRRSAVRRVAAAAAFVSSPALIHSIVAPTPLQAQSAPDTESVVKGNDQELRQKEMDRKLDQEAQSKEAQQKESSGKNSQEQLEKAVEERTKEELDKTQDSERALKDSQQEQQAKAVEVIQKQQEQAAKNAEQVVKR